MALGLQRPYVRRPHGPGGSAQMENPTKASTATLRTMIAMAATSMVEKRFAMRHRWRKSDGSVDLDHAVPRPNGVGRRVDSSA